MKIKHYLVYSGEIVLATILMVLPVYLPTLLYVIHCLESH